MTACRSITFAVVVATVAGCGSGLTGTYRGDVRLMAGREETDKPGYSLAEVRERIAKDERTLTLLPGGRFALKSRDSEVEGEWHREGNTVITLDDTGNGKHIQSGLRVERKFAIGKNGELIHGTSYNYYNLEEFYSKD